jgi:hypothetical protein
MVALQMDYSTCLDDKMQLDIALIAMQVQSQAVFCCQCCCMQGSWCCPVNLVVIRC